MREHLTLQKGTWSGYAASPQTPEEEEVEADQSPRWVIFCQDWERIPNCIGYVEFDVSECPFEYLSSSVLRDI